MAVLRTPDSTLAPTTDKIPKTISPVDRTSPIKYTDLLKDSVTIYSYAKLPHDSVSLIEISFMFNTQNGGYA